jgi:superfamily II DNA or RNA helicase
MLQRAFTQLLNVFSESCLREGMQYVKQDGMLSVRLSDGLLHARVKGSMGRLFDVYMDLKTWPTSASRCTCESHFNCEHAAASLLSLRLKALENQKQSVGLEQLDRWIQAFQYTPPSEAKLVQTHQLFYYLQFQPDAFSIQLAVGKSLKNGSVGKRTLLDRLEQVKPIHQHESDAAILTRLNDRRVDLNRLIDSELLLAVLQSQRALDSELDLPWQFGKTITASVSWLVETDGTQHWILKHADSELDACWLDAPWYIDPTLLEIGQIKLPYAQSSVQLLRELEAISPEQCPEVRSTLADCASDLPLPFDLSAGVPLTIQPKPVVILDRMTGTDTLGKMELAFDYEGMQVRAAPIVYSEPTEPRPSASGKDPLPDGSGSVIHSCVYKQCGSTLYQIPRDLAFEQHFTEQCKQKFALTPIGFDLNDFDALARIHDVFVPWVEQQKGRVLMQDAVFAKILDENEIEWYGDLNSEGDFFAYELGILMEGKKVNLVPVLVQLISQYRLPEWEKLPADHVFRLNVGGNQILPIKIERIRPFIEFLLFEGEKYRNNTHAIKLKRYQWVVMQASLNALSASLRRLWSQETLMKHLYQLLDRQQLPTTVLPQDFLTTLRDYQQHGLDWLQALRECGFGGVLADDMGLGKTVQTLAHLLVEKQAGRMTLPTLIIAPLSLIGNWQAEIQRFTPTLKTLIYHGTGRQAHVFTEYDLVISTYGLVQRDKEIFLKQPFYYLILDEAQWIKNARAQTTLMVQQLQASFRLCLSGTPFENHLGELWSLFHFIMPGLLLDRGRFRTFFQDAIEKQGDPIKKASLMKRVQPFLLRRTKQQVAQELPDKTIMISGVVLVDEQRDLYELIRLSMEKRVRDSIAQYGMVKSQMVFLDALLKLRQVCCDPRLVPLPMAKRAHGVSAKLTALMELLETLIEEDRRILVFSQFTSMLAIVEDEIKAKGYDYLKLTGKTQNRQQLVDEFQNGKAPIFLMSLKAGGVGLNLTKADTVIHYDPWWNPAVEDQATDRTHRLGQLNPVFVYRLVAEGTVEEVMMRMQAKKRALFEGILSEQQISGVKLTEEDLAMFFQPLV